MSDMPSHDPADDLFDQASAWYYRLQAEDVSDAERQQFVAWKARGVAQAQAWDEVIDLLGALREPARQVRQAEQARWQRPSRPAWRRWAAAAAVLLLVGGTFSQTPWPDRWRADYATATGATRHIVLEDGSKVQLNTDSALQVQMEQGERKVRLLRGEAWFEVAPDASRPFVIRAGSGQVKVVGTRFSVARVGPHTRVKVEQGRVEVAAASGQPVLLTPGKAVEYDASGLGAVHPVEAGAFAWRQRQLVFIQQPLGEVLDELNRYWPGQTLLLGDALRERKVSGVYEIDKPDAVLKALTHTLGLRADHYTPYLRVLREG
jgi:transmembrane sensor